MKDRVISFLMAVIMLGSMYYLAQVAAKEVPLHVISSKVNSKGQTVVIDPGHGGKDPGKIGVNQVLEKDINLVIAKRVASILEQNDIKPVMTRTEDEGLYEESASNKKVQDMKNRINLIMEANAVLTVSIHQNSFSQESVRGAQVFYYTTSTDGKELAQIMQSQLINGVDPSNSRDAKANNSYYLLKKSVNPTIIVECGFLSNYEEAEKLNDAVYQEKMAFNIAMGIMQYLNKNK